jgi:4-hydroxy-tetrahydrodipicolinate synthase
MEEKMNIGMAPATILPMTKDFEPDLQAYRDYLKWLITQNADSFAVNMDTGEGPQLTVQEKIDVIRAAKEIAGDHLPVLAGISAATTTDAMALGKRFAEAGADALVVFPNPAFRNDPLDPRIPVGYHQAIADASGLSLVLFQLAPIFGGVNFTRATLLELLKIPQVVAIKEASFDAAYFAYTVETLALGGRDITLLTGNDRFITESLLLGANGALLGFAAIGCGLVARQLAARKQGDYQCLVQLRSLVQTFADYIYQDPMLDYRARCKAALARIGVIKPSRIYVRPPLFEVPEEAFPAMDAALRKAGML